MPPRVFGPFWQRKGRGSYMSESRVVLAGSGPVVVLRLNNPPVNAFDDATRDELGRLIDDLHASDVVRAVVLYGGQTLFAAGADIATLQRLSYSQVVNWNRRIQRVFDSVAELPVPVIAALTGHALGGGLELALAADYRVAEDSAKFGLPEVQLGIMPGSGGTQRMARLVGPSRAKHLMMTGRRFGADEALSWGVVDEVVPRGSALDRAVEYASELSRGPAHAIASIKNAVDLGLDGSLAGGLALERTLLAGTFASPDRERGMASFLRDGPGRAIFVEEVEAGS